MSVPHLGLAPHLPSTGYRKQAQGLRCRDMWWQQGTLNGVFSEVGGSNTRVGFLSGTGEFMAAHGTALAAGAHQLLLLSLPVPPWHRGAWEQAHPQKDRARPGGHQGDHGAGAALCHHPLTPPCSTREDGLTQTLQTALTHARRFSRGPVK